MKVKCGTCRKEFELKENTRTLLVGEDNLQRLIYLCDGCDKKIIKALTDRE